MTRRPPLTINDMAKQAYAHAKQSGFHERHPLNISEGQTIDPVILSDQIRSDISVKLALIHSEASEALEEVRANLSPLQYYRREDGKPEGLASELADIIIRVGDLCGSYNIDLEAVVTEKLAYNRTRPPKHGKNF